MPIKTNTFNAFRAEGTPALHRTTCALLAKVWRDDFESFGLVNPDEDPVGYTILRKLDEAIRHDANFGVEEVVGLLHAFAVLDGSWINCGPEEEPPTAADIKRAVAKYFKIG